MTFEFLITCQPASEMDIRYLIVQSLAEALENSEIDFDEDVPDDWVQIRHWKSNDSCMLVGFGLELPERSASSAIVNDFVDNLQDNEYVSHIVKFEDPLLQAQLADRAKEIFFTEMKLRRVLSFIYLRAYEGEHPYELLMDEKNELSRRVPSETDMKSVHENEFFYLEFGQYADLNDVEQQEIHQRPIKNEDASELIANLKGLMRPVQDMRNCAAHNRNPAEVEGNYPTALHNLNDRLDQYLLNNWVK